MKNNKIMKYLLEYKNIPNDNTILLELTIRVKELDKPISGLVESSDYRNYIYTKDVRLVGYKQETMTIGFFNPYKFGRIYLTTTPYKFVNENDKYVENSMYMLGGFLIVDKFHKMKFGKMTIEKLFIRIPELENIVLFAEANVGGPFWKKIGAEKILELKEDEYDYLSKGLLKQLDVYSGDVELLIINKKKFLSI
jgi:predicted acetyltransferase